MPELVHVHVWPRQRFHATVLLLVWERSVEVSNPIFINRLAVGAKIDGKIPEIMAFAETNRFVVGSPCDLTIPRPQ